jgi:hypothetical protein
MPATFRYFLQALLLSLALDAPAASGPLALARHLADYDSELRLPNGRVDIASLTKRLSELGVSDYYWLVWHAQTDWDDLKSFLPQAARAHIRLWVYLVPPSEGPSNGYPASEPFKLDYPRWGEEIARLSKEFPNLVGWIIDDFYANHQFFTPAYIRQMQSRAKSVNPRLVFFPLLYFPEVTPQFLDDYREEIDGVVVAYPQDREEIAHARSILNGQTAANAAQLVCAWHTPTEPGDFVSATIPVQVVSSAQLRLHFQERDDFNGATSGYHFKQALLDSNLLWEADVAGGTNSWHQVELQFAPAPQASSMSTHLLQFRLFDKKGVSNFGVCWDLKELKVEGLKLEATLSRPEAWKLERQGPFEGGFGKGLSKPRNDFHVPFVVMTAGSADEFKLRHGEPASPERMAQWLRMCLEARRDGLCEGVVTYCLDKRPDSLVFPLADESFQRFR